jgi:4'-phosphopantetheinyl transferase
MSLINLFEKIFVKEKITHNTTSIYVFNYKDYINYILEFKRCLPPSDLKKAQNYCTEVLANKYIISRGVLRNLLGLLLNQPPILLDIKENQFGKPYIEINNIFFNLSHSNDLFAFALSREAEVGLDVEYHNQNIGKEEIFDLLFSKEEINLYYGLNEREKVNFFYNVWTKKEALLKCNGVGLNYNLPAINTVKPNKNYYSLKTETMEEEDVYYCYSININKDFSGAVAIKGKASNLKVISLID